MNNGYCPICWVNPATSPHHITPRAEGGTDDKKNIVDLCKRCHDIVEEIYDSTGVRYSSSLVKLIRLEFTVTGRPNAQRIISEGVRRKLRYRFPEEKQERLKIEQLTPVKVIPELLVLAAWSMKNKLTLASSGKRLYIATNGRAYVLGIKSNALHEYPGIRLKSTALSRVLSELGTKVILS